MGIFSKIFGSPTDESAGPDGARDDAASDPMHAKPVAPRPEPVAAPSKGVPPASRPGVTPALPPSVVAQTRQVAAPGPSVFSERLVPRRGALASGATGGPTASAAPVPSSQRSVATPPRATPAAAGGTAPRRRGRNSTAPAAAAAPPKPAPRAAPRPVATALELEPLETSVKVEPAKKAAASPSLPDPDDVDAAFGQIMSNVPVAGPGKLADDRAAREANARLFREMAVEHARPLREFRIDLSLGMVARQWVDVARPAAKSIVQGARELGEPAVVTAFEGLVKVLDRLASSGGSKISDADREALLREFEGASSGLPGALDVKSDRDRREPLLIQQLLALVPGMRKVAMDRLFAAGLSTLEAIGRASVTDLTSVGGLDPDVAAAVMNQFRAYARDRTERSPAKWGDEARRKLRALTEALGRAHEDLLDAESAEDRARKRRARAERRTRAIEMNILLVQLGEVDLVDELERSATERRIARIQSYVNQAGAHP